MYIISSYDTGEQIGVVEKPAYIKMNKNGVFVRASATDATGIAYKSTPYNLTGRGPLGSYPYVNVYEVDDGTISMEKDAKIKQLEDDLATTDETAIALYETSLEQDDINAAQDDSLIELYEMIGGKEL